MSKNNSPLRTSSNAVFICQDPQSNFTMECYKKKEVLCELNQLCELTLSLWIIHLSQRCSSLTRWWHPGKPCVNELCPTHHPNTELITRPSCQRVAFICIWYWGGRSKREKRILAAWACWHRYQHCNSGWCSCHWSDEGSKKEGSFLSLVFPRDTSPQATCWLSGWTPLHATHSRVGHGRWAEMVPQRGWQLMENPARLSRTLLAWHVKDAPHQQGEKFSQTELV